jgi:hypothetical protein
MHRLTCCFVLSASLFLPTSIALAQQPSANATATCNFDRTKQVAVEYQRISVNKKKKVLGNEIPYGKVWTPGGKPMTLFTNAPVSISGTAVPIGAYTMFVIPEEKSWTLIISRSTDMSGKYDEHQDLARIAMKFGELPSPEPQFTVYFAHVAPTQCNMRMDLQKARAWVVLDEK